MRVSFQAMYEQFLRVLLATGCQQHRAALCAAIFAKNSCDGVYSHGLNMFPQFIKNIQTEIVNIHSEPEIIQDLGAFLVLDGKSGPGPSNAYFAMEQAIRLMQRYGIGCAAIRNTNHWARAGTYAIQAADANGIGICWTNTMPNMPAWGAKRPTIGNNPLAIALPKPNGHLVLDIAMSQFSIGKMRNYLNAGQLLPICGGYDGEGNLTTDPGSILKDGRVLPMGFWKGSGLAMMLDLLAAILSGGNTTFRIGQLGAEQNVSQIFIAMRIDHFADPEFARQQIEETVAMLHYAEPVTAEQGVCYPGQRMLMTRADNLQNGIPVEPRIWQDVLGM